MQERSQNAKIVTHVNGRLLKQGVLFIDCIPFQSADSLKGKNLLANSREDPILKRETLLPH